LTRLRTEEERGGGAMKRIWRGLRIAGAIAGIAGCSAASPAGVAAPAGGLRIRTTDVQVTGQVAKVRGEVKNTYDQPVQGIRYLVKLWETTGDEPRLLDTYQHEVDTTVAPGESKMMRLDVESIYLERTGTTRFTVEAIPKKLGGHELPPPQGWK
jgi:hypothetical protein